MPKKEHDTIHPLWTLKGNDDDNDDDARTIVIFSVF